MNTTHNRAGYSKERAAVGKPGHCDLCACIGHVAAHPNLGCGDVGCDRHHDPADEMPIPEDVEEKIRDTVRITPEQHRDAWVTAFKHAAEQSEKIPLFMFAGDHDNDRIRHAMRTVDALLAPVSLLVEGASIHALAEVTRRLDLPVESLDSVANQFLGAAFRALSTTPHIRHVVSECTGEPS